MKTYITRVLSLFALAGILQAAEPPKANPDLLAGKKALRAQKYVTAVAALDKAIKAKIKQVDEAMYLRALALYHGGKYNDCVKACDGLLAAQANSRWVQKAKFLKAGALARDRKFEEAETIYEAEANRLLSAVRKQDVAGVIITFADALATKPKESDLKSPPPNYNKAYNLYKKALAMEIGRDLRDMVTFKAARAVQQAGNFGLAIQEYQKYLAEFDPDWTGNVGSITRASGQKRENPKPVGKHPLAARFRLAESQLKARQHAAARTNLEDLLVMLKAQQEPPAQLVADSRWTMLKAWQMPSPGGNLEKALRAAREFLADHKADPRSVVASWWITQAYSHAGRTDETIVSYNEFIAMKNHELPKGELEDEKLAEFGKTPAKLQDLWQKVALYQIGSIQFAQKKYADATKAWQDYIKKYPDGPNWADSQRGVIDAEFQVALDEVSNKKYAEAQKLFDTFLTQHPLDDRAQKILFIYGQIAFEAASQLEKKREDSIVAAKDKPKKEEIDKAYEAAIDQWRRLVSKYPNTEASSVALYRIARIQEEKLGNWAAALESHRALRWGSRAYVATTHVTLLTRKSLALQTERKFRTNEKVLVKLNTRNIKKVTVRQYFLNLESYFRKTHAIGSISHLDIALIEPDKQWEVEIKDFTDYKPMEQNIEVPFANGKAGVCIINVSDDNFEASTMVIRSDLDLIVKSSRRQALVFVEDRVKHQPVKDVKLLFSDGKKVFAAGTTANDGVFVDGFDELKAMGNIRVFAVKDGHVASNTLSLRGMQFSSGLAAKGYLYTDRPAYLPGQTVKVRGVIRDVKDGSYVAPAAQLYLISVTDSAGRLIWEQEKKLSDFGTFSAELHLDNRAPLGSWQITARAKDKPTRAYGSQFTVQRFQLEKIRLELETEQPVYFRGEEVELDISASYYWGQPVAEKQVHYYLPDGRHLIGKTDAKGALKVKFDTTGLATGTLMQFRVSIDGENVQAVHQALLASEGFGIAVRTSQPLVLAGEPFDVAIETHTPDGKPVGREITLKVLRRAVPQPDPVLDSVPLLRKAAEMAIYKETTIEVKKVTTNKETGKGTVRLTLEKGGNYVLRASGTDRFDQVVTAEGGVSISDDDDATKLRFFAESDTLQVGGEAKLRLHSRLDGNLALLTFEGETIISHRVITLKKDFNNIPLAVSHEHFPNFRVCVSAMDGRDLRVAHKPFTVERQLKVVVKPQKDTYAPGAKGKVDITVTDQLGKPVAAELSLALIDEALFAIFPDNAPYILEFFQEDARRYADFRVNSSTGFRYTARTTKVLKELLNEQERLARKAEEAREIAGIRNVGQAAKQAQEQAAPMMRIELAADAEAETGVKFDLGVVDDSLGDSNYQTASKQLEQAVETLNQTTRQMDRLNNNSIIPYKDSKGPVAGTAFFTEVPSGLEEAAQKMAQTAKSSVMVQGGHKGLLVTGRKLQRGRVLDGFAGGGLFANANENDKDGQRDPRLRREMPGAGVWLPAVKTDKDGKATVEVTLPETSSQWRLTARGVTVQTLVGQATAEVVTRKDFFVSIKAPQLLQEGDSARILARVHNLTDFEGDVELTLSVFGGYEFKKKLAEHKATVAIKKDGAVQVLFPGVDVPLSPALKLQVEAKAGNHEDLLARAVPVRPWGLEFADHAGGVSKDDEVVILELPKDRRGGSQWLTIAIGPNLKKSVIDMALGASPMPQAAKGRTHYWLAPAPRVGGFAGSDLLAAVAALEFSNNANAPESDQQRLANRVRSLVGALVVSQQKDGGWVWRRRGGVAQWSVTAVNFWGLCRARDLGIPVHADTIKKAQTWLTNKFSAVSSNDNDAKATILFALSANKAADFAHANRLHRERHQLSAPALAYTALTFVNLERNEFAGELLDVMAQKMKRTKVDEKALVSWAGVQNRYQVCNDVESTALAALAFMRARPAAAQVKPAIDYLLQQRGAFGFSTTKARGPAVAALAEYFGKGKFAAADFRLTVLVNGKKFDTIASKGAQPTVALAVPHDQIADGPNRVEFRMEGQGEYAYAVTLRGFSSNLEDPKSWRSPYVKTRKYLHRKLEYRNKPIGVSSSSPVKNIEIGQHVHVHVDLVSYSTTSDFHGYRVIEEHLPAGMMYVEGSLSGGQSHLEVDAGILRLYFSAGVYADDYSYDLIGYSTGKFRVLPTVIRDVVNPDRMRVGGKEELVVLGPGVDSDDKYVMNDAERYAMGKLNFDDGNYDEALGYLSDLFKRNSKYNERDLARMLLWIYTSEGRYDAQQVISVFEILRERYPALEIPFDRILVVGKAYRDLGEWERAYLVFSATIDASFINDVNVSAVLDDEGQFLGSIDFQEDLWREYPDTAEVTSMLFSISQALYLRAPTAHQLAKLERKVAIMRGGKPVRQTRTPERIGMLKETIRLLGDFMTLNPESPLGDDAAFSMANALLDLKQYDTVIRLCGDFKGRYPKSEFASGYQYMVALGHFWKHDHDDALKAAMVVADGKSRDKNLAEYIVGQIHHAEGSPAEAIAWYEKVKGKYPDAKQAIDYFEEKRIALEEVNIFRPGKDVELKVKYRNIKEAHLQVYRVDLMKLYLREKNLSKITQINLAGIEPMLEMTVQLGDGKDYIDKEKLAKLAVKKEGAYLVICRGDDLFTSALALVTPLKIEVQEDKQAGRVRANVMDAVKDKY
ncbi:MAG: tetratricopeptide repeat protein, partial [Verrucomicrobiota bacterium]|nr:tetratricopeptide repeat protein [Verrucomicrobiota bacterium]